MSQFSTNEAPAKSELRTLEGLQEKLNMIKRYRALLEKYPRKKEERNYDKYR